MAPISSINGSNGLQSTIRGFGGLASGLDRDALIEQFTAATRSKIAKQKQKQQTLKWTQEALRGITDKIYDFSSKFTSFSSPSNLTSSKLFSRSVIGVNGINSKYVSATGSAASAENLSINGIKQMAANATATTGKISSQKLETGSLNVGANGSLDSKQNISTIEGDVLHIKYGKTVYSVTMGDGGDNVNKTAEMINEKLKAVEISGGKKLSDVMKAEVSTDGKLKFSAIDDAYGNRLEIAGGTGDILQDLGFLGEGKKFEDLTDEQKNIAQKGGLAATNAAVISKEESLYNILSEKKISFAYNGKSAEIQLDKFTASSTLEDVKKNLQDKLNEAFGKGRIQVEAGANNLSFKTITPDGKNDASSTIAVVAGEGIVGKGGIFGIESGASNRINMSTGVDKAGFANADQFGSSLKADGSYYLSINGVEIQGITKETSVEEIVKKINESKAGVKIAYQSISDQFVITATENGAAGEIKFDTNADGQTANLASLMFEKSQNYTYTKGQDAIVSVSYPGSKDKIEITRGTNTFDLDGINVTLKGEFGYENGKLVETTEAITFSGSVDSENTTKTVKEMIEGFNEILALVNKEVSTKPSRDYAPLTEEQKKEMSESEIKRWEEEAKKGLLFADTDMRGMANSLRTVINLADRSKLAEIGITVSEKYSDNGKLVFDEAKFKAALEKDPDAVKELFNRSASESGSVAGAGFLTRMSAVMDRYGKTTGAVKGILVERAGSVHAPTSIMGNHLQKQINNLDGFIDKLNDKLAREQDRYISQFTTLETLINQMNSQSSYLSSMFTT